MKTRISFLALTATFALVSHGASLTENVAAVESCRVAITNAIVARGGTASGALTNAAAEIAALPSGEVVDTATYNDGVKIYDNEIVIDIDNTAYGTFGTLNIGAKILWNYAYANRPIEKIRADNAILFNDNALRNCSLSGPLYFKNLIALGSDVFYLNNNITEIYAPKLRHISGQWTPFEGLINLTVLDVPNLNHFNIAIDGAFSYLDGLVNLCNVMMTNQTYSAVSPYTELPWGGPTNGKMQFQFRNGVVKYDSESGTWILYNDSDWVFYEGE